MIDIGPLFTSVTGWFDGHPAILAWLIGWVAALSFAQTVKQILPPKLSETEAKRVTQFVAMASGTIVARLIWPEASGHAWVYAVVVGMSAPSAYTFIKAVIEWRFERLAYMLSWQRVQDRNDGDKK